MKPALDKGGEAEECLRNYFLNLGYFVVRGIKFRYEGFDITDVDLWLYGKMSGVTRERVNVDIKNKKTPQAIERVFWAKGLQRVLGNDRCIVATTDSRSSVVSFGIEHDVTVLDGAFLSRLFKSGRSHVDRIAEEELLAMIDSECLGKLSGDWRGRFEESKSRLLHSISFDGCNAWLEDIRVFFELCAQDGSGSSVCWRLAMSMAASFLIAVDFILSKNLSADQLQRRQLLESGFRYGDAGKSYMDKIGKLAASLVKSVMGDQAVGDAIESALTDQAQNVNADSLADCLSKGTVPSHLFDLARELENAAYTQNCTLPSQLSSSTQAMIGALCDFHGIDRKKVLR